MNINENKEIANAEPEYILLDSHFRAFSKKYVVSTLEVEYDPVYSIFSRTVGATDEEEVSHTKTNFWFGVRSNNVQLFFIAGARTINEAFETVLADDEWFKNQISSVLYAQTPDDKSANPDN